MFNALTILLSTFFLITKLRLTKIKLLVQNSTAITERSNFSKFIPKSWLRTWMSYGKISKSKQQMI